MSGFEKFQTSEAWRTSFKKFIFMERKPLPVQQTETKGENQRYSLDIDEDLKNILDHKKNQKFVKFNLNEPNINKQNTTEEDLEKENENPRLSKKVINDEGEMNRPAYNFDNTRFEDKENNDLNMWQKTSDESFEALEKMCEKTISDPNSTLFKYLHADELKGANVMVWQKTSDESFEALEKMCDKTASDPDSTLFQYLHSDHKEQVLAHVKKRSADGKIENHHENDPLLIKLSNCTMLDEIEEPSRMWENTICGDKILQTSPIKMVGLLRPSTIIEEAPDDSANSDISSQMSFQTATKGAPSDISSSTYDTAFDSTVASTRTDVSNSRENQLEVIDVDHLLFSATSKVETNQLIAEIPSIPDISVLPAPSSNENINEVSVDLIDLDKTFGPLHNSPHSSILLDDTIAVEVIDVEEDEENSEVNELEEMENEILETYNMLDDSVIEILSDEDEENIEENVHEPKKNDQVDVSILSEIKLEEKSSLSIKHDTFSFTESYEENKEVKESSDKSMQFNDTMEEVEYMLQKGKEYMAAEAAAKQNIPEHDKLAISGIETQNNSPMIQTGHKIQHNSPMIQTGNKSQHNSPMIQKKQTSHIISSASKVKCNYKTPAKRTPSKCDGSSSKNRFATDITKPFPKLDIFAKPPTHARHRELSSKQQKFSHIVSPIGTYMKKTATTPLMASLKSKNKNSDVLNSSAFRELENESRLYKPTFETNTTETLGLSTLPGLSGVQKTLPKKAYISSELKHIVDERTPVTIPGGKKIQKYLENAMMPAVLRHDGKLKIPGAKNNKMNVSNSSSANYSKLPLKSTNMNSSVLNNSATSHIPRRNNASLADLSLMSGDVSMYTIMDAQKF